MPDEGMVRVGDVARDAARPLAALLEGASCLISSIAVGLSRPPAARRLGVARHKRAAGTCRSRGIKRDPFSECTPADLERRQSFDHDHRRAATRTRPRRRWRLDRRCHARRTRVRS